MVSVPEAPLSVERLCVEFETATGPAAAVSDVSFRLHPGEITGLVGESGSGKTVTGLALLGLLPSRQASVTGSVMLSQTQLVGAAERELRNIRGTGIAMIFQDALTALDPVFTIGTQITETIRAHENTSRRAARERAVELLDQVGIPRPRERMGHYPHQLSGGMRQRVMIAIALACRPQVIVADEPTTALDLTIQAQILELLRDLCRATDAAVLLVTHDLGVVAESCDRVLVMYAGEIVESAGVDDLLSLPRHPYTAGLLGAIPRAGRKTGRMNSIRGRVPALGEMPAGCRFADRCDYVTAQCRSDHPPLLADPSGRQVRCLRAGELLLPGATASNPGATRVAAP
jgi:peptide/nickel transport system ATP-binding protein